MSTIRSKAPREAKKSGESTAAPKKKAVNVFHQRLGSLTFYQASQLLGDEGSSLIRQGGAGL
jgi:hypothetical protein